MRAISYSVLDSQETLHVCIWWWDRSCVECFMAIRCRTWDRLHLNRKFLWREPSFLYSEKREYLGARELTFGVGWPWKFARMDMVMGWTRVQSFMAMLCGMWYMVRQIANFYVGNLHFRIVKNGILGKRVFHIPVSDGLETWHICIWWWDDVCAQFHGHPLQNVRSRASKSPISM